jgi:hypothetical protein
VKNMLLRCICCMGRVTVTIPIGLYCTLVQSFPTIFPLYPFPAHLKNCKKLHCHVSIWSPPTIFPHLNLFYSPFPSHKYPYTHTYCTYLQSCFSLLLSKLMFKGVSWWIPTVSILCFTLVLLLSLTLLPPVPHFSTDFSTYPYVVYLHRC